MRARRFASIEPKWKPHLLPKVRPNFKPSNPRPPAWPLPRWCAVSFPYVWGCQTLLGIIFGIIALRQINGSAGVITGTGLAIGGLVTSALGIITIFAMLLLPPALARAKSKANRVKCVNNMGQLYVAGLTFAQDNGERLPWQLNAMQVRNHFGLGASNDEYGKQGNTGINEVTAHPNSLAAAGVFGLLSMKHELQTPKILHSPCDSVRAAANEKAQENWNSYDTKAKGVSAELGKGASYVLCRGADTQRPSSVYALTRNCSTDNLNTGKWLGSDSDPDNARTMAGLTASQGQIVTMDGGAKQSHDADLGATGVLTKTAARATGGVALGRTSLNLIRGPGL